MFCCVCIVRMHLNTQIIFCIDYLYKQWESDTIYAAKQLSVAVP